MNKLVTEVCGMKFEVPWTNGSGVLSQPRIIARNLNHEIGGFVTKSTSRLPRKGFYEPIVYHNGLSTINAFGLANPGVDETARELGGIYPLGKPLIASIVGDSSEEFAYVAKKLEKFCDAIEMNVSCPNKKEGEKIGIEIGRDPELVRTFTCAVKDSVSKPVIVKLSPSVYDIASIAKAAEEGGADAISVINTVAGATMIDPVSGSHYLTNKYGGLSGPSIKPIGVAAVRKVYENVKIPIFGGGGIKKADDVIDYLKAGAKCTFIATAVANKSTKDVGRYFDNLKNNFESSLYRMNVGSVKEIMPC
jgi:dihydroorotate dehydrogenase (NAD+) catalytic subunit